MEELFASFRENTIGIDQVFTTPYGDKKMIYADWIASGRLYKPIEDKIANEFGPFVANTHTETSESGVLMTRAYHEAKNIIRRHVNANEDDVVITPGTGMTGAINKLQRILGLKGCGKLKSGECIQDTRKPVVFVTHLEHHSNHTSWYETHSEVVILKSDADGLPDLNNLRDELEKHAGNPLKIGSFSACSNVTGVRTNYAAMAKIMHQGGGLCFVDFAANAPYENIDMHPSDPLEALDAIFFSPHKFLGGPGSSGVLIFNKRLYKNSSPDHPGGGTVDWTNAWGEYKFSDDIEVREDGGTPGFLQAIRIALAIRLKEKMGVENIIKREHQIISKVIARMENMHGIRVLESRNLNRIGAISFYHPEIHYNLFVKLLNDRFGVQVRGGCACAGTYGHILFNIEREESNRITDMINQGDLSHKPGFVRLSIHPVMTDDEVELILRAIDSIAMNFKNWEKDYIYNKKTNEFTHVSFKPGYTKRIEAWFEVD